MRVRLSPPPTLGIFTPPLPPSKYVANRALLLAAVAEGTSLLRGLPDNDDLRAARAFAEAAGAGLEDLGGGSWRVRGTGGRPRFVPGARIDLGASGTLARFALAFAALGESEIVLDGSPRLRERPMGELLGALAHLGARVGSDGGRLPVRLRGPIRGGTVRLSGRTSSQFASALLLAGPLTPHGIRLVFEAPPVSAAYIALTRETMAAFGSGAEEDEGGHVVSGGGAYRAARLDVPPDPTALGYFAALAALVPGAVLDVAAAFPPPRRGEARFLDLLETMGAEVEAGVERLRVRGPGGPLRPLGRVDVGECPDSVPTLAVLAATAPGETRLGGVGHLRHKESDRPAALAEELSRLGLETGVSGGEFRLVGRAPLGPREGGFSSHDDHRLAMSLALLAVPLGRVVIDGAEAVTKSFPDYWAVLSGLGFGLEETA